MTDLRSVFQPARATASPDTDKHTRAAYAICRAIKKSACDCEFAGEGQVCPERMRAVMDAEKILVGEG